MMVPTCYIKYFLEFVMKNRIRHPAVAGLFYPEDPGELRRSVQHFLSTADTQKHATPKAIIAPHAGYIYSGAIAGTAYRGLEKIRGQIVRVIVLGPSHRAAFRGVAASSADWFATPLGNIAVDKATIKPLVEDGLIQLLDQAHSQEHSLEVQLPFLQETLGEFKLVPLVVGDESVEKIGEILNRVWNGPETLIVISSDLSHYHTYEACQAIDANTTRAIEHLQPEQIGYDQACGRLPMNGLLTVARERGMQVSTLDVRNSGDTAGSKDRVVGYGAYWLH